MGSLAAAAAAAAGFDGVALELLVDRGPGETAPRCCNIHRPPMAPQPNSAQGRLALQMHQNLGHAKPVEHLYLLEAQSSRCANLWLWLKDQGWGTTKCSRQS